MAIVAAATEVSKTTGGQLALNATGEAVATIAELGSEVVHLFVGAPIAGIRKLREALGVRAKDSQPERLQLPPATIAAPATLQYLLLGEGETWRCNATCSRTCWVNRWTARAERTPRSCACSRT
jgi:hypothetical protein